MACIVVVFEAIQNTCSRVLSYLRSESAHMLYYIKVDRTTSRTLKNPYLSISDKTMVVKPPQSCI
jgi:hypothetical protein